MEIRNLLNYNFKKFSWLLLNFISVNASAQPNIQWAKCFGGSLAERANCIQQTREGGYVAAGISMSNDSDLTNHYGTNNTNDYWILKLDSTGDIEWQKNYGGSSNDVANYIQQTFDGGYIVAGHSTSTNGDVIGHHGTSFNDYWILKLDSVGTILWSKCLGGTGEDVAYYVEQLNDSSYIITGYNNSFDGDVTGNHNFDDYWVVKLDIIGNIEWQKSLGGFQLDVAQSPTRTNNNGYVIAGYSNSNDGDVSGNHGNFDFWVVGIDSIGDLLWQKCYGGSQSDIALNFKSTFDNGFIIVGYTTSNDGDISLYHGDNDYWIVKLDSTGNILWQKTFGGSKSENALSVFQTNDSGYVVAGNTYSSDGDIIGHHGTYLFNDYWILKLDAQGNLQWQKTIGGIGYEEATSIQQTTDNGFIVGGFTGYSDDGDVSGNNGDLDYWIVKLAPLNVAIQEINNSILDLYVFQKNNQIGVKFYSKINHNAQMYVYDMHGKNVFGKNIILKEGFNYNQINCNSLSSGLYYVKITTMNGSRGSKILLIDCID